MLTIVCIGGLIFVPDTSALEGGDLLKDESAHVAGLPADTSGTTAAAEKPKLDVLMIGDSVSVRAIPNFTETFPYGAIDAAVNRQLTVGEEVYRSYAEQDIVGDVVVFALGTNGQATDEQLDDLLGVVGTDKHVFFVNTRSPQSWMAETNAALDRAVERYSNVQVIDWYSLSASHGTWFDGDGTHLSSEGAQAYIDMVHDAIGSLLPEHKEGDQVAHAETPMEAATSRPLRPAGSRCLHCHQHRQQPRGAPAGISASNQRAHESNDRAAIACESTHHDCGPICVMKRAPLDNLQTQQGPRRMPGPCGC